MITKKAKPATNSGFCAIENFVVNSSSVSVIIFNLAESTLFRISKQSQSCETLPEIVKKIT
jgi:hypothetical protein